MCLCLLVIGLRIPTSHAATAALVGWGEEGLHEIDGSDMSVYAVLPPYSTIHAQLMRNGLLVSNATGLTVTYEAVADATGSINKSSAGKGNFYQHAGVLYGLPLLEDEGLAGFGMPGSSNQPQPMVFDPARNCFTAIGIPITPYDDRGGTNRFPMMRLVARDSLGSVLARTDIVLPVSDEKSCVACHRSGSDPIGRPAAGWVWDCDPDRDYKLNILRHHDDHYLGVTLYSNALSKAGYNAAGLYATVTHDGQPILCLRCHVSNALPGSGLAGLAIPPLTQVMHTKHSFIYDPDKGVALNEVTDSSACFRCHAGPEATYLRGAHANLAGTNGSLTMTCQTCHGKLADVGRLRRQGWIDEPTCQSCHTGTALTNNGQFRYTSVFDSSNQVRQAIDATFATQPDTPSPGLASYRFSQGHGGLACAACHGSAHAEWISSQPNENVQSQQLQGNTGVLINCNACHLTGLVTTNGGPHGLHPIDANWANDRHTFVGEGGAQTQCKLCHGADSRGTALSLAGVDHTFNGKGTVHYWPGYQTGCYNCHRGAGNDNANTNSPAATVNGATNTVAGAPVTILLQAADPTNDPLTMRIVSPPLSGKVSLQGNVATYFPTPGSLGHDSFTFAAWNGSKESNLGSVDVQVDPGSCQLAAPAWVPVAAMPNRPVPFRTSASLANCVSLITYDWDFGDGAPHSAEAGPCHSYAVAGDYSWTLTVKANGLTLTTNGVITISSTLGPPLALTLTDWVTLMEVSWPWDPIPVSLEASSDLEDPYGWQPVVGAPFVDFDGVNMNVWLYPTSSLQQFRLRRVP